MATILDEQSLAEAFQGRTDIQQAIRAAAASEPYIELFNTISQHICSLAPSSSEPASKKRKLEDGIAVRPAVSNGTNGHASSSAPAKAEDPVLLEVKEISMVVPQRKKYTLCFTATHLYAKLPDSKEPVSGTSFAWADIEYAFCLPVPEKTQKQYNYILFPKNSNITPAKPVPGSPPIPEPLVFTISDAAPKPGSIGGLAASAASAVSDDCKTLFDWVLSTRFKAAGRKDLKIVLADPKLFASEIRQSHRPNEKGVHVKAFRGSKDGYLFFLPNGILWAFKKPLLFLPHEKISAVSFTSVLQRTFNLSIEIDNTKPGEEESTEEIEFSMVDKEDFGGIDGYAKRYGLQNKSMAEQRKAKKMNVNVIKDEDGNVIGNAEAGELAKAEGELGGTDIAALALGDLDEEDEEEEDYDPGSEGESEGSGTSSEDDDDDDDDGPAGEGGPDDDEDDGDEEDE